jgi:iron complex transport system ATP-binding protein
MIRLDHVSVAVSGLPIVADASLTLGAGRFVALVGPNGAGKTTLLKSIAGLLPAEGRITLGTDDLAALPRQQRARRIAYLPQGHQAHWPLAVRDIVALGRFPHGLADPARLSPEHARAITTAMDRTGVLALADRAVTSLSGGERARVMLARVLAVEAAVILADEPTASLDPRHQLTVMQDLVAESRRGTLVVAVTHDIGLAHRLADDVVLMDKGRVAAFGSPDEVLTDERVAAVYGITVMRQSLAGDTVLTPWEPC